MLPATSDEPRYNSTSIDGNTTPGTSNGINRTGTHYISANNRSNCSDLVRTNDDGNEQKHDNDLDIQIDPPKGFEPILENGTSSSDLVQSSSATNDIIARSSCSSNSSRVSTSSSLDDCDQFAHLNKPSTRARLQSNDMIDNTQNNAQTTPSDYSLTTPDATTPATNNINVTPRKADRSHSENNIPEGHSTTRTDEVTTTDNEMNGQGTHLNPIPSTSTYPRMMNGFTNIVTRITKALANTSLSMINGDRCSQDDMPRFAFGHKRSLEKTWKLMDKVVKCCQRQGMNLNNSPPFILEILPETYQHLKLIHTKYNSSLKPPPNDNEYSQVFLCNLQARCKQTLRLFKDAREEMFNENSEHRHKLTRHTLVFNHILSELKAIFPGGKFIGEKYLITKKEGAGEFWRENFGSSVLVDWRTFYHALQEVHSIDSSFFSSNALKQTMDLTCDDNISIFEFDVFTRLFQPWARLLRNWQILAVTHPGYKAFLTYDELKARLQKHIDKPGSYVFRLSCTRLGQWAIGYVTHDRQILQTIVQNISLSQALTETKFYLYPDGNDEDPSLNVLCSGLAGDERNVTVTEEQYEIYCGVGNSFQTCKICFENDKDIRVEPCNHLLCTSCLIAWQESDGQGCPYCRTEIKETVQITMNLPKSKKK